MSPEECPVSVVVSSRDIRVVAVLTVALVAWISVSATCRVLEDSRVSNRESKSTVFASIRFKSPYAIPSVLVQFVFGVLHAIIN